MAFPRRLPNWDRNLLSQATYQIMPGSHGGPMVQLNLVFPRTSTPSASSYSYGGSSSFGSSSSVTNPDMTLALLLDRSGSMTETYRDGHVFNAASAILSEVGSSGFDLVFYDTAPTYVGHIGSSAALATAINRNAPQGGGTRVADALRETIKRYHTRKGVYVIVVTDGEFSDKTQVQAMVLNELLPMITPENPYALRLHFVGAGEEVDHEFLQQLETQASGRGVTLVRQHHHTHLHHTHASILDELDTLYVGAGSQVRLEGPEGVVLRVGDPTANAWHVGHVYEAPFIPRHATIAVEFADVVGRSRSLDLRLTYVDAHKTPRELTFAIPLPRSTVAQTTAAGTQGAGASTGRRGWSLHLPWRHASPDEQAARDAAAQQETEREQRAISARQSELDRQSQDMQELARGGIPVGAQQRLRELSERPGAFTSNLDPDELGLLRANGYRPRGVVSGSAMYHVGQAYASSYQDSEVRVLTQAYDTATALAVSRMEQEVRALGAHGAVGVRMVMARHEWADKTVEVRIIGTAVMGPGPAPQRPWLTDLSGQEWWSLRRAGYDAVGLVWGHCTWFVLTTYSDEQLKVTYSNSEYRHWGDALSRARHVAQQHLLTQAREHGATGVVGVRIARRVDEVRLSGPDENPVYEYEHHTLVLSAVGTAIRLCPDAPQRVRATVPVLSLRDGRFKPMVTREVDIAFLDAGEKEKGE